MTHSSGSELQQDVLSGVQLLILHTYVYIPWYWKCSCFLHTTCVSQTIPIMATASCSMCSVPDSWSPHQMHTAENIFKVWTVHSTIYCHVFMSFKLFIVCCMWVNIFQHHFPCPIWPEATFVRVLFLTLYSSNERLSKMYPGTRLLL